MIPFVFDSAQSTSVSPWIVMDGLKWGDLVQGHTPRRYRKGQIVYYQEGMEDCIYLVKQGRVNISLINSQGKMRSLYVADKGCLFGKIMDIKEWGASPRPVPTVMLKFMSFLRRNFTIGWKNTPI